MDPMSSCDPSMVSPGKMITNDSGFMRYQSFDIYITFSGHGTYVLNGSLYASVAGTVERVNKLLSVKALRSRYVAEIGDVVIGRILEVQLFALYSQLLDRP